MQEKRPLGRTRRRWKDNVSIDLKEIYVNTGNRINSAEDADC